jgi:hypothetical protein
MSRSRKLVCLLVAALIGAGQAGAEQSCSAWMDQGDGTSWTTCVDENGTQRCYRVNNTPGSTVFEVSCSQ